MDRRHQHFIVARINGRYRSLATIHQQRVHGLPLVKRCRDTLKILRAGNNRVPIQEEVKAAERYEEGFWTQGPFEEGDHSNTAAEVPFPFLMTCLMLGTTYDVIGGFIGDGTIGQRQMKYSEGGKNDSITIYDITDQTCISYCFVMLKDPRFPLMVPLSAGTYLDTYYHVREVEENSWKNIILVLEQVESFSLVPTAVLEGIWPDGDWKEPHDSQKKKQPPARECDGMATVRRDKPRSLRDHAIEKLVQTLVENPESARQVAPAAEVLADFWPRLKGKIYEHAKSLRPSPALLDLLCATLKEEMYVDLSPFHTLTCEDLSLLVSRLQSDGQMRRLNLSHMPNLTSEGLASVLVPGLRQRLLGVYLMENPQISVESLCPLNCACDVYHSELLRRSITHKPVIPNSLGERDSARPTLPHLDFLIGENAVTQIVLIGLTEDQTLAQRDRKSDGSMFWETLNATAEHTTPTPSHGSEKLHYDAIPLLGVPFSTTRLVTGFWNLLWWYSRTKVFDSWTLSTAAARSFAYGHTSLSTESSRRAANGVGPLSPELYLSNTDKISLFKCKENVSRLSALSPGQWAIIVVQECCNKGKGERRIKYALVSPTGDSKASSGSFRVADIHSYLEQIVKDSPVDAGQARVLREWWRRKIDRNGPMLVSFYQEKDIHKILQKIYGPAEEALSESHKGSPGMELEANSDGHTSS